MLKTEAEFDIAVKERVFSWAANLRQGFGSQGHFFNGFNLQRRRKVGMKSEDGRRTGMAIKNDI